MLFQSQFLDIVGAHHESGPCLVDDGGCHCSGRGTSCNMSSVCLSVSKPWSSLKILRESAASIGFRVNGWFLFLWCLLCRPSGTTARSACNIWSADEAERTVRNHLHPCITCVCCDRLQVSKCEMFYSVLCHGILEKKLDCTCSLYFVCCITLSPSNFFGRFFVNPGYCLISRTINFITRLQTNFNNIPDCGVVFWILVERGFIAFPCEASWKELIYGKPFWWHSLSEILPWNLSRNDMRIEYGKFNHPDERGLEWGGGAPHRRQGLKWFFIAL